MKPRKDWIAPPKSSDGNRINIRKKPKGKLVWTKARRLLNPDSENLSADGKTFLSFLHISPTVLTYYTLDEPIEHQRWSKWLEAYFAKEKYYYFYYSNARPFSRL
jgi:hypothetical protein